MKALLITMPVGALRSLGVSIFLCINLFGPSKAMSSGECPPVCPSGPPYAEVDFHGETSHAIFQITPPFLLEESFSDSRGNGYGFIDLSTSLIRAESQAAISSVGQQTNVSGSDVFMLGGLPVGTPVVVRAGMEAYGYGRINVEGAAVAPMLVITTPGYYGNDQFTFQGFNIPDLSNPHQVPLHTFFSIHLATEIAFDAIIGTPFPMTYSLYLGTNYESLIAFPYLYGVHLTFYLPPGVTITSAGGFSHYGLTVIRIGEGIVTSSPAGINCGADCSENYPSGATVTLTAIPVPGYLFANWSGDCKGTNATCALALTADRQATAIFILPERSAWKRVLGF